jgi:hypothetical protein
LLINFILECHAMRNCGICTPRSGVAFCTGNYKPCVRIMGSVEAIREVVVRNCHQKIFPTSLQPLTRSKGKLCFKPKFGKFTPPPFF